MPALTYTVTDPVTGSVFKSRRKTRPYGAVIVDGPDGPRVDAWAGRPDLLTAYHRRAVNGTRFAAPQVTARTAIATESHPAIRARLPRTLAGLSSHPWVESVSDERGMGAGIHVYLRPGFVWDGTTSAVIESTVREACQAFRGVTWDPEAWSHCCGASAAEVATLTGEAAPAPAEAAPAPAARRRLNPLAETLLTRLQATDRDWLVVEVCPIVGSLRDLGWIVTRHDYGTGVECQITIHGRYALAARPCDGDAAPAPRPTLPGEATPPPAPSHGEAAPTLPELRADAAAGRPVSLSAVARAAQSEMAARRAARRAG